MEMRKQNIIGRQIRQEIKRRLTNDADLPLRHGLEKT